MPIDDATKNSLVINVSNLVRHSHVKVDVQRFSLAFRMSIDQLEPGAPVELEPIFQYLVSDLAVPEKDALELCIVIASRKDKLQFPFTLPLKAQNLSTEAVEHIVDVHNDKRTITGSWDVKKLEPEKPAEKKKGDKAWEPGKKSKPKAGDSSRQTKLALTAGASLVIAIGFNAWLSATAKPPIVTASPPPDGLPCTELIMSEGTAICTIPQALFGSLPEETLGAKAMLTKSGLRVKAVWVRTAENRKIVHVQ